MSTHTKFSDNYDDGGNTIVHGDTTPRLDRTLIIERTLLESIVLSRTLFGKSFMSTFFWMLRTFPTTMLQVCIASWSIIWAVTAMTPGAQGFYSLAYGWMAHYPSWVWASICIGKGIPHWWAAVGTVHYAKGNPYWLNICQNVCIITTSLDLFFYTLVGLVFITTQGFQSTFTMWYVCMSVLCFWILSRLVSD